MLTQYVQTPKARASDFSFNERNCPKERGRGVFDERGRESESPKGRVKNRDLLKNVKGTRQKRLYDGLFCLF